MIKRQIKKNAKMIHEIMYVSCRVRGIDVMMSLKEAEDIAWKQLEDNDLIDYLAKILDGERVNAC